MGFASGMTSAGAAGSELFRMDATMSTHARHIRLGLLVGAAIALVAAVVTTVVARTPSAEDGAPRSQLALVGLAAPGPGRAGGGRDDDRPAHSLRTEAPIFVLGRGRFVAFDGPERGAVPHAVRINDRGDTVGEYRTAIPGPVAGGFMRDRRGRVDVLLYPGSAETIPTDINDHREIVGNYRTEVGGPSQAFVRDRRGRFSTIRIPGAVEAQALGINNRGLVVGDYTTADGVIHGYRWSNGRVTTFDGPTGEGGTITDINDHGDMVGLYSTEPGTLSGFLLERGRYTTFDHPDLPLTVPYGINNRGHIVGTIYDALEGATTEAHGFVLRRGADGPFTPVDIPGAIVGTAATGINDRGQIVGVYGNPDATVGPAEPPGLSEAPVMAARVRRETAIHG